MSETRCTTFTGYGTDGRIWGGEVLLADYRDFERAAHFAEAPLPGGDPRALADGHELPDAALWARVLGF